MAVQSSAKKWVFIGGGLLAAALVVVFFQNYPPKPEDATGTIGAAQRYHESQITGADVKVDQTTLDTVIQSDAFDRIMKDPEARKLFTSAAMASVFNEAAQHTLFPANDAVRPTQIRDLSAEATKVDSREISSDAVRPNQLRDLNADAVKIEPSKQFANDAVRPNQLRDLSADAVRPNQLRDLSADAVKLTPNHPIADQAILQAIAGNQALAAAFSDPAFCRALASPGVSDALVDQARGGRSGNTD